MNKHNFYTTNEVYAETFYQLPKIFFTNEKYKKLSSDAKISFALLKERFNYSIRNNWCDEENRIYFIFTVKELCEILNCGTEKVTKIKKELEKSNLLFQKRVGVNQPNRLYLLKPEANSNDVYVLSKTPQSLDNSGISKIENPPNSSQSLDNSGISKIENPPNSSQSLDNSGISKIENNKYIYNNLDTLKEDTKEIDTREQQQEHYLLSNFSQTYENQSFLNKTNLDLIGLFSESLEEAESMQGIILRAKKAVEKQYNQVVVIDENYLHDDLLDIQLEITKTLRRIYQKRKTDKKIKDFNNYAFGAFKNMFTEFADMLKQLKTRNDSVSEKVSTYEWV